MPANEKSNLNYALWDQDLRSFGFANLGPVVAGFLSWLNNRTIELDQALPIFISRDTEMLFQVWNKKYPQNGFYLQCSRASLMNLTSDTELTRNVATRRFFQGSIKDFMLGRFGVSHSQTDKYFGPKISNLSINLPDDMKLAQKIISDYAEEDILNRNKKIDILKFHVEKLAGNKRKNFTCVDVGYSGTLQKMLSLLMPEFQSGFYFITDDSREEEFYTARSGWLLENQKWGSSPMLDNALKLELLLQSKTGPNIDSYPNLPWFETIYGTKNNAQYFFRDLQILQESASESAINLMENFKPSELEELGKKMARNLLTQYSHVVKHIGSSIGIDDPYSGSASTVKQLRESHEIF